MKIFLVFNEEHTEGFFTTDEGVAYEARKSASSNCYDKNGIRSDLAVSFCNIHGQSNCTMLDIEIPEDLINSLKSKK